MFEVQDILNSLTTRSSEEKAVAARILSKLDIQTFSDWKSKLIVIDGAVAGTYYGDLAEKLSFNDFVDLYKSLGYDFSQYEIWKDHWCSVPNGDDAHCVEKPRYSCNTHNCRPLP